MNTQIRNETGEVTANRIIFSWFAARFGSRLKIPFGIMVFVIVGALALLGYIVGIRVEGVIFERNVIVPYFISALYIACVILLCEKIIEKFMAKLNDAIIPAMKSPADLANLVARRSKMFDVRSQVSFAAFFSIGVHVLFILPNLGLIHVYGWGIIAANLLMNFFHGVCVYFLYSYAYWVLSELPGYDFKLYPLDPSSSKIVRILAGMFNYILYGSLVMITIMTVVFTRFHIFTRVSVYIAIVLMWVTAITIFAFDQAILAKIIQKGKWETLNKIQAEIEELQTKDSVPSPETLAHIEKLVALHNNVNNTPNSALNFRSFLEFLNSLLLPTVGVLVGTIGDIRELMEKFVSK